MWLAAYDHCTDTGAIGHTGSDGSTFDQRLDKYGSWSTSAAENISFGSDDALVIVLRLFIDDGIESRGHRVNMLSPDVMVTAISTCPHLTYGHQAVITYAGGFAMDEAFECNYEGEAADHKCIRRAPPPDECTSTFDCAEGW